MLAAPARPQTLRWFGSSGIRGPLAVVDTDLALRVGRAVAHRHHDVVIGRDARRSGPALESALIAGLLAGGAHVHRAGVLPTPALAHAACGHDLGIQVTASHNPAPDNGIKLWRPDGTGPSREELLALETHIQDPPRPASWEHGGAVHDAGDSNARYMADVVRHVRRRHGPSPLANCRIALDCAHGAGALATPPLLSALGAELTVLGGTPDGRFPDRPSEPTAANLGRLRHILSDGGHAFGIAHDGDADRTIFLAADGAVIPQERLFAVLAAARGDATLAVPVDASGIIGDHLPDADIRITRVGDPYVSAAIADGATFACEPSGTWFFSEWSPTPEGPFAAAAIAALLATEPALLEQVAALPTYHRRARKVPFPDGAARGDIQHALSRLRPGLSRGLTVRRHADLDGVRLDTDDGWLLVRPSGTEPIIRITTEARDAARAEQLAAHAEKALRGTLEAR